VSESHTYFSFHSMFIVLHAVSVCCALSKGGARLASWFRRPESRCGGLDGALAVQSSPGLACFVMGLS